MSADVSSAVPSKEPDFPAIGLFQSQPAGCRFVDPMSATAGNVVAGALIAMVCTRLTPKVNSVPGHPAACARAASLLINEFDAGAL